MPRYTNLARVQAYLGRDLSAPELVLLNDVISYYSSFIQTYTNRQWLDLDEAQDEYAEVDPAPRRFNGSGAATLYPDDFIELEKIVIYDRFGSVFLSLTEGWTVYPLNSNPKQFIKLTDSYFPSGQGNIELTAIWGTGLVPDDVVMVVTVMVASFLSGSGAGLLVSSGSGSSGELKSESIEGYSYTKFDPSQTASIRFSFSGRDDLFLTLDKWKKFVL